MRAKLGGRYAKYAKISKSPEKAQNIIPGLSRDDVGISKTVSAKKEKLVIGDEGRSNIYYLYFLT